MADKKKEETKQEKPIRILVWGDSPAVATGFANVIRNIFTRIAKNPRFQLDIIGINDGGGWKDPEIYGYQTRIYPALAIGSPEIFGRPRLVNSVVMKDPDIMPPFDLVFTLNDPFILEQKISDWNGSTMATLAGVREAYKKEFPPNWWFKIISYWPIDSALKENWYKEAVALPDQSVAYAEYGKQEIELIEKQIGKSYLRKPLKVLYHGVDLDVFKPLPQEEVDEFRKTFFGGKIKKDTFVCMIVARNQPRKDLSRAMKVFREFNKRRPDSFLYIHSKNSDAGGTLTEIAKSLGLKETENWGYPAQFSENKGYPDEVLNKLYNTANCVMSTTLGEGFGLPLIEAMAVKKINIAPDNTTIPELFNTTRGDGVDKLEDAEYRKKIRGVSAKSGSNDTEWFNLGGIDKERFRPLTNVEDMVSKLLWVYDHPMEVEQIQNQAYEWVKENCDWNKIAKQWEDIFLTEFGELEEERSKWIPPKEGQKAPDKINVNLVPEEQKKDVVI